MLSVLIVMMVGGFVGGFSSDNQKSLFKLQNMPDPQNQTTTTSIGQSQGVFSPFDLFEQNNQNLSYTTIIQASIEEEQEIEEYEIIMDTNLPFTFILEKQTKRDNMQYSKILLNVDQQTLVLQYLEKRFPLIKQYMKDVYLIVQSRISINRHLSLSFSFFYMQGEGASLFRSLISRDGYMGLGLSSNQDFVSLNLIVSLYEQKLIDTLTFSAYYGNQPGYIDSVIFVGDYNSMSIDHGFYVENMSKLQTIGDDTHNWCFRVQNISLSQEGSAIKSYTNETNTACIEPTSPFMELSSDLITLIINYLNVNKMKCSIQKYNINGGDYDLLECQINQPLNMAKSLFPTITLNISTSNDSIFQASLKGDDYIYSCQNDVYFLVLKCLTLIASKNSTVPKQNLVFGLPFLRSYYTYYDLNYQDLYLTKSVPFLILPFYSTFWYYTLLALLFFWSIIMITCGVYYKEQMNLMMTFVVNIIKFAFGDQEARRQILIGQMMEEQ